MSETLFARLRMAYMRGAAWRDENGSLDLVEKASYDYADKETSPPIENYREPGEFGEGATVRRAEAQTATRPVSAIEAIEKAMEGVTHTDAPEWIAVAQDGDGPNGGFWTCAAATTESPRYIRADIYSALARQAEALQRENAELREALKPFGRHETADGLSGPGSLLYIPDDHPLLFNGLGNDAHVTVTVGDIRRARALIGGSDAGN